MAAPPAHEPSGTLAWFEREIAAAKTEQGTSWHEHRRWVVEYTRREMAEWIGEHQAAEVVEKAAVRARARERAPTG